MTNATDSSGQVLPATSENKEDTVQSQDDLVYASAELSFSDVDDWFLKLSNQNRTDKTASTKEQTPSTPKEDDEIAIPAIFLTQGAKNFKLLRQSEEINRQMTEDELRMKAQATELSNLQSKFLAELNDNGSRFTYTLKNNGELVEKYVQKYYSKNHTLTTHRHFFYFREVEVSLETSDKDVLRLLTTVLSSALSETNRAYLGDVLSRNGVDITDFVHYALVHVHEEGILRSIAQFLVDCPDRMQETGGLSISSYMERLGAIQTLKLPLKLVHYNNQPRLLILRLSIVFFYKLRSPSQSELHDIVKEFMLAMSDFILNSKEKSLLLGEFVRPVFEMLVSKFPNAEGVITAVENVLSGISTHIYGEDEEIVLKNEEIRFNILNSLWVCFSKDQGDAGQVVIQLSLNYLKFSGPNPSLSVPNLTDIIQRIGEAKVTGAGLQLITNTLYKNMFRAQIVTSLLVNLMYETGPKQKKHYLNLRLVLLDCKDHLQESIGRLLYMKTEDVPLKPTLSMALSETYHTFEHFSVVLDKNMAFIKIDLFYESE